MTSKKGTERLAQQSTIEWTDLTWNPVVGCSIESSAGRLLNGRTYDEMPAL
jgi:protein gp37